MSDEKDSSYLINGMINYRRGLSNDADSFFGSLKWLLDGRHWENYYCEMRGSWISQPTLKEFITHIIPEGLETTPEWIYSQLVGPAKLKDEVKDLLDIYYEQMLSEGINLNGEYAVAPAVAKGDAPKQGGDRKSEEFKENQDSNTTLKDNRGSEYTIRRLLKEKRQDLVDQIKSGDISTNAAAIEAGFRKKYYQIEATREAVIAFCKRHEIELGV